VTIGSKDWQSLVFIHLSPQKNQLIDRSIENELLSRPILDNDNHWGRERVGEVYLAHPLDGFSSSFGSIAIDLMTNM
jgi:hypothetical protein